MSDHGTDTHSGSRRADVWGELREARRADSVEGRISRFAELRNAITAWRVQGERLRGQLAESVAECEEAGMIVGPLLTPSEKAFFDTYESVAPGDPPLPVIHEDNS